MIQERILELTEYGLVTGLVEPQDKRFTINRLLELFHIDELEDEVTAAYEKRTPMTQRAPRRHCHRSLQRCSITRRSRC